MKLLIFIYCLILAANAATITWDNDFSSGDTQEWSVPSNWSPQQVPSSGDDVVIPVMFANFEEPIYFINVGTVDINSLTMMDAKIVLQSGSITLNDYTREVGYHVDLTLTINGNGILEGSDWTNVVLNIGENAVVNATKGLISMRSSEIYNDGEFYMEESFGTIYVDPQHHPVNTEDNSLITNNGVIYIKGEVRFHPVEIIQSATGSFIVDSVDEDEIYFVEYQYGEDNYELDEYNGAPSTWDGLFQIKSGGMTFDGGEITWKSGIQFDLCDTCKLYFGGDGIGDYENKNTFEGDFIVDNGIVVLDNFGRFIGSASGRIDIANLDFRGGRISGEADVGIDNMYCNSPWCCLYDYRTFDGVTASIYGNSTLGGCYVQLDNEATLTVESDVHVDGLSSIMEFTSSTLENPGTIINKGTFHLQPQVPTAGPHTFNDVNFVNEGIFRCVKNSLYEHCLQIYNYYGSYSSFESRGIFDISAKTSNEEDYLFDFDDGWAPLQVGGNFNYYEGHEFQGNGIVYVYGTSLSCGNGESTVECQRRKTHRFHEAIQYTQMNVGGRIILYTDGPVSLDYCLWDGGVWAGTGETITINKELTIADSGLGSGAERYLYDQTIIIKNHIHLQRPHITGFGSSIIIEEGSTALIGSEIGVPGLPSSGPTPDLSFINYGVANFDFGDWSSVYSGVVNIQNNGVMQMKPDSEIYQQDDANPSFKMTEGGVISFNDDSVLVINLRKEPDEYDEPENYCDHYDFYNAKKCSFGGILRVNVMQRTGCVPSCPTFAPKEGEIYNIMHHRYGENGAPCYGEFEIEAVGLEDGLKFGIEYNEKIAGSSDSANINLIVCKDTDSDCGSPNQYKAGENDTEEEVEEDGSNIDSNNDGTNSGTGNNADEGSSTVVVAVVVSMLAVVLL
eukprot:TRINITY_DN7583_c0_g1_i1.p1 TRINITY_DN7583_c0_g1~~TRINITY_DN7583_c0_g1_i1.p1  ORF type:complete len:902 (-),score=228.56 TRINITY_DN7583_c0_g1_i1:48-2753(-)